MFDAAMRRLEEKLKRYIDERLALQVKIRPYSVSSADGTTDKVQGYTNDEQKYDLDGQRMWPFGIRSRPPQGVDSVWVAVGGPNHSSHAVIVGAESSKYGPSDLQDGETAFYNKVSGCVVRLNADGTITINGSTYSAPQWDAFATALTTFTTACTSNPAATDLTTALTLLNAIRTAANTLGAAMSANSNYKSSKVKWG